MKNLKEIQNQFIPFYTGEQIEYPSSYDNVISVSSISHYYEANDPLAYDSTNSLYTISNYIKDSFSPNVNINDPNNPIGLLYNGWPRYCEIPGTNPLQYIITSPNGLAGTTTFNNHVDILAQGFLVPNFPKLSEENIIENYSYGGTSSATPYVTGTVALMLSVNNCLTPFEVDNILKLTTKNVLTGSINQNFIGKIGAGSLNSGDAVEFTNEMIKINGIAKIYDHIFNRFNFELNKINNKLELSNVTFKENCTAIFNAKNQIRLLSGTNLSPNTNGFVHLAINPSIDVGCSSNNREYVENKEKEDNKIVVPKITLFPNPNNGNFL